MSYSSGTFNINSTGQPVVTGTVISSTTFNAFTADIATGLSTCVLKDGTQTLTANIPMSTFRFTGVGDATARTNYVSAGQVQDGALIYISTVGGTADAITLTPSPAITAYAAGQYFSFIASGSNTTAVTVQISGLANPKALTRNGTTALLSGDIVSGSLITILYDGTRFQLLGAAYLALSGGTVAGLVTLGAAINDKKGTDVASATSTPIGAAIGKVIDVTGTTTITSFDTIQAGTIRIVRFTGALTLTHNGTSLILPGAANITTAAGDVAIFVSLGSGNWYCGPYSPAASIILSTATQADQETGTSTTTAVSPGRQQYHASAAKVWAYVARGGGTPVLSSPSYNVSSVTDGASGITVVNLTTAFSTSVYSVLATAGVSAQSSQAACTAMTAGTFTIGTADGAGTALDTCDFMCVAFGDQ